MTDTLDRVMDAATNDEPTPITLSDPNVGVKTQTTPDGKAAIQTYDCGANMQDAASDVDKQTRLNKEGMSSSDQAIIDGLLEKKSPTDPNFYEHPRYYGLRGGVSSFTTFLPNGQGGYESIQFVRGAYATNEVRIVEALEALIKNPRSNVSGTVQNITRTVYRERQSQAQAYQMMLNGSSGVATSLDGDAQTKQRAILMAQKDKLIAEQKEQIEALIAEQSKVNKQASNDITSGSQTLLENAPKTDSIFANVNG